LVRFTAKDEGNLSRRTFFNSLLDEQAFGLCRDYGEDRK